MIPIPQRIQRIKSVIEFLPLPETMEIGGFLKILNVKEFFSAHLLVCESNQRICEPYLSRMEKVLDILNPKPIYRPQTNLNQ